MDELKQMEYLHEVFDPSMPRLGPGDDASTIKALETLLALRAGRPGAGLNEPENLKILDVGCGNGAPTIQLAKHANGTILAVDNYKPFLDELQRRAEAEGVSGKIRVHLADMRNMGLEEGTFDLVWSEGALFVMGFREGVAACRSMLAPGGLCAVTELTWLKPGPPEECAKFFANVYPAITSIEANLAAVESCGFEVVGHFILPKSAWRDSYYVPLEDRLRSIRKRSGADPGLLEFVEVMQMESDIYRKYSDYYGYVFFLMRR